MQPLIIYKPDFKTFAAEADGVVYLSIQTTTNQHFAQVDVVLSAFNAQGRGIQLKAPAGQDFLYDEPSRRATLQKAFAKQVEWEKELEALGLQCRFGILSTAEKAITGAFE